MPDSTLGAPVSAQSPCPLCPSAPAILVGSRDRRGRPLSSLLCLGCALIRVDPLPSPDALRDYYREKYRLEYKGVLRPRPHHVLRAAHAARERLRWLKPHIPGNSRWLDVGAGSGEFAFLLHRLGHSITALEPNRGYADYVRDALRLPVFPGFLEDLPAPATPFDAVSCFHMLEHHPNPVDALRSIAALLRPDSLLAVEVPNAAFPHTHPNSRFHPAHLVHFTAPNLEFAARAAGFLPVSIQTSPDGGILCAVFRRSSPSTPTPIPAASVDAFRQAELERSPLRYYASPAVWNRTLRRLSSLAAERVRALSSASPVAVLSRLDLPT